MDRNLSRLRLPIFALLIMITITAAHAVEPLPENIQLTTRFTEGGSVFLVVQNLTLAPVSLRLQKSELGSIPFAAIALSLGAGEERAIDLSRFDFGGNKQSLGVEAVILDRLGNPQPGPNAQLFQAILSDGSYHYGANFDDAFLSSRQEVRGDSQNGQIDLGGGYIDQSPIVKFAFPSHDTPAGSTIQPFNYPDPLEMANMPLGQLPDLNGGKAGRGGKCDASKNHHDDGEEKDHERRSDDAPCASKTKNDHDEQDSDRHQAGAHANVLTTQVANFAALPPGDPLIKGKLSLKYNDATFHPAWGWVAVAWQQFFGIWIQSGWSYIDGAGNWQINFFQLPGVNNVYIEYRAANRFVQLQDAGGNIYAWGDSWPISGAVIDVGSRFADLSANGDLPNVDKLYAGATNVWVKFYNNGMNALRDKPIQVTFPNALSSGHCIQSTDTNGNPVTPYAWSCSETANGKIWVIPQHGFSFVVQHEIGHSINSYYWGGSMPAGAGGAHSFSQCYNNGLAVSEGFANFLAYWVQFDRTAIDPKATYANRSFESPTNACAGPMNETWVAATFWDMYDYWNDGSNVNTRFDSLYFINQASPVAVYLGNKKNGMPDYLGVINASQNSYWQGEFTKLFRLNTMIP